MTTKQTISDSVCKTFLTLVLLSRSVAYAEKQMLAMIESWSFEEGPGLDLVKSSVPAALLAEGSLRATSPHEIEQARAFLPDELKAVLLLEASVRQCFVLRVLAEFSRHECAKMLKLDVREVEELTCSGLQLLGELVGGRRWSAASVS